MYYILEYNIFLIIEIQKIISKIKLSYMDQILKMCFFQMKKILDEFK